MNADDIAKIMVDSKYRFPLTKDDKAIYLVDVPEAAKSLESVLLYVAEEAFRAGWQSRIKGEFKERGLANFITFLKTKFKI